MATLIENDSIFNGINVDKTEVIKIVNGYGLDGAARQLGFYRDYNYHMVAGRLLLRWIEEKAPKTIKEYASKLSKILNDETYSFIMIHHENLQVAIDEQHSKGIHQIYDFQSIATFLNDYMLKPHFAKGEIVETPEYLKMRVAVQVYGDIKNDKSLTRVVEYYKQLSNCYFTHATPTLINAGTMRPQMKSCFITSVEDDLSHIQHSNNNIGLISRDKGGNGVNYTKIRHSEIGELGWSDGLVPQLEMVDRTINYCNQGGTRKGAETVFLEPWHIDIFEVIQLAPKKQRGMGSGCPTCGEDKNRETTSKTPHLHFSIWNNDLFMERVYIDGDWTLFCPARVPGLEESYGSEFRKLYLKYEGDKTMKQHHRKSVKARDLWDLILRTQIISGMPFIMYKDASNYRSNQKNLGPVYSNLCQEIVEHASKTEIGDCNLASVNLKAFVKTNENGKFFDYDHLSEIVRSIANGLDLICTKNFYPVEEAKNSAMKHRPMAIGVSGFANAIYALDLTYDTEDGTDVNPETKVLHEKIFACMYFNALAESVFMAIEKGEYETFRSAAKGASPYSQGDLAFDLWVKEAEEKIRDIKEEYGCLDNFKNYEEALLNRASFKPLSPSEWGQKVLRRNGVTIMPTWESLKYSIMRYGLRNSLFIGLMPTATSARIMMNCESFEPHIKNCYLRKLMNGVYVIVNSELQAELEQVGIWSNRVLNHISQNRGSVQKLLDLEELKDIDEETKQKIKKIQHKYRTAFEIKQKVLVKYSILRSPYIDQSQSLNVFMSDPSNAQLNGMHFYGWMNGLKTGMYYLRTEMADEAVNIVASKSKENTNLINDSTMNAVGNIFKKVEQHGPEEGVKNSINELIYLTGNILDGFMKTDSTGTNLVSEIINASERAGFCGKDSECSSCSS